MSLIESRVWTIRELMKYAINLLQRKGFDEARLTIELLLSTVLRCQRIQIYTRLEKPLTSDELELFSSFLERRLTHEPVQYIIGSTSFMGLHFQVDRRVLIPRPETETLVEQTMIFAHSLETQEPIRILEVGTGCGNIAVSLAKYIRQARILSLDVDEKALEVARQNVELHAVSEKVVLQHRNIFDPIDERSFSKFDILVSNPPYIAPQDWEHLMPELKLFEPRLALSDERDGYLFYERMIVLAPRILNQTAGVLFEVGDGQSEKVLRMLQANGFAKGQIIPDLQGLPRVVTAWLGKHDERIISKN
ncbi:MAG: peptide chain release factor N(5)-glutamine methyltransferase [bacterium]